MTDIIEQSRDPLDFLEYTGREGAARIEITSLRQQLAECQAKEYPDYGLADIMDSLNQQLAECQAVAKAAKALLDKCDEEGLLLGGGRNSPDEKEGPMVKRLRKAINNMTMELKMTDIVEQLREASSDFSNEKHGLFDDAADEIESLRQQLAECQAREKVLGEMVGRWLGDEGWCDADMGAYDDCLACDSTALDTMLKAAKREQAEKCFDRALLKSNGHGVPGILEELHRMAKELE